jgi:hypothetical protein
MIAPSALQKLWLKFVHLNPYGVRVRHENARHFWEEQERRNKEFQIQVLGVFVLGFLAACVLELLSRLLNFLS